NSTGLVAGWSSSFFIGTPSEELLQVHAGVELAHLLLVAIEHQRLPPLREEAARLADAPLGGLAPARVIHVGVHVGIEAIFGACGLDPRGGRLLLDEADLHDALGRL